MNRELSLLGFLVLVIGRGLAIGYVTAPGEWYAGLAKPSFNPPGWIFGPFWTVLYVLIAVAGWRTFERARRGWQMRLWWRSLRSISCGRRCSSPRTGSGSRSSSSF